MNVYICWCTKEIKLCREKRAKEGKNNPKEPTVFTVGFCIFAFILNYLLSCIPNKFLDEIQWFSHHNHMQGLLSISVCLGMCPDFHSECNVKMNLKKKKKRKQPTNTALLCFDKDPKPPRFLWFSSKIIMTGLSGITRQVC